MRPNDLITKIRIEYLKARKPIVPANNIIRGTSHSISSITEDFIALYLKNKISKNFEIWIDPQITIKAVKNSSGKRSLLFRPDICIMNTKTNTIDMIFDIKMDLGYKRNGFIEQVESRNSQLSIIKKFEGSCSLRSGKPFTFSTGLDWNYIVISQGNVTETQYSKIESYFMKNKKAKLYTLVINGHLNTYEKNYLPEINKIDFQRLDLRLKEISKRN